MPDLSNMKLGKMARRFDPRVRAIAPISHTWPPAPKVIDWTVKATDPWGLMLNDKLGCCTISKMGHAIQTWTSQSEAAEITIPDADILRMYQEACGYDPARPDTDQGGVMTKVAEYWRSHPIAGHSISAVASVAPGSRTDVMAAVWLFGGCDAGVQLPNSAQSQDVWDIPPQGPRGSGEPGSWGGHDIWIPCYDDLGLTCITWGAKKRMSWSFWDTYCVTPETRILSADLKWVAAGSVAGGDKIMGFDEDGPRRRWKGAFVECAPLIERPCFELEFDDGTIVRCSAEHQWLCSYGNNPAVWVRTNQLRSGGIRASHVIKPVDIWETDLTRDGGYIAAAFDGEGCLIQHDISGKRYSLGAASTAVYSQGTVNTKLAFTQKQNPMLRELVRCLQEKNIHFRIDKTLPKNGVMHLTVGRRKDILRLLGSMRPLRLLDKFEPDLLSGIGGGRPGGPGGTAKLIRRTDIGDQKVVAIKTTSRTYIAEGLASHNCDEAYCYLSDDWLDANNLAPTNINLDQLKKYLNEFR